MSEKKPETSVEKKPVQQEANVKTEEKKVETYKVYGTEFSVQNPEYIEFYKARFKIMAVRYNLIGRVNNNSVYVIPNEIKADLINMPKEIEDMAEDYYTASSMYMKKYFYFKIKLTMLENGKARASLYLYESVREFFDDNYIITRIADYIDDYNEDFRVKLRKYFNLVDVAVPVTDFIVPNLAVLMQDNLDLTLSISPLYEIAAQIYLLNMLKLLEGAGEVGEEILLKYNKLKKAYEEALKNEKFKNTFLKILLDRTIDEFGGIEKLKINKFYIEKNVQEMNQTIKMIEEKQKKFGGIEIINDKKEEKKKAEAPKVNEPKKDDKKKAPAAGSPKKKPDNKGKANQKTTDSKKNQEDPLKIHQYFDKLREEIEQKKREREESKKEEEREKYKHKDRPSIVIANEEKNKIDQEKEKQENIEDIEDSSEDEVAVEDGLIIEEQSTEEKIDDEDKSIIAENENSYIDIETENNLDDENISPIIAEESPIVENQNNIDIEISR